MISRLQEWLLLAQICVAAQEVGIAVEAGVQALDVKDDRFFPPILEHFCPFFVQIAQMGLILSRWGLILPIIPPPTLFFTQLSQTPFRNM